MILSKHNLVHFLMEHGLVTPAAVVDGGYAVHDLTRRNRNFRVTLGDGTGLFVKQAQDWTPYSAETIRREAACYRLARTEPAYAALGGLLPRDRLWDETAQVLVLELLPGRENLSEYHHRHGRFPLEMATRLGTMLGTYHREAGRGAAAGIDSIFPRQPPWILSVHFHNPSLFGPVSAGIRQMLGILESHPDFGRALDAIRTGWRHEALVHGDMKWENCIVLPPSTDDGLPDLRIVDWELADVGDPCWDVGSLFQAYLCAWILSMPMDGAAAETLIARAHLPVERMQPAMRTFWQAYVRTRGAGRTEAEELMARSIRYAAARMIQTAWEWTSGHERMSPQMAAVLQVSLNVLARPDDAVVHLLGIDARMAA
ncbi:MAG TPA: phosphotransferase [Longimicrobiaceae bacterium]|jgi:hypothetical protein|nr:phosphotransferase [Longimicrobiaceae bacterium]